MKKVVTGLLVAPLFLAVVAALLVGARGEEFDAETASVIDGDYRLRQWRLADSKRGLCWSASNNTVRKGLGEPHAISLVHTSGVGSYPRIASR